MLDTPKTKAGVRELPLAPDLELQRALQAQLGERVADLADAPLFPRSSRGREYLHPNVLRNHFGKAIDAANVKLAAADRELIPEGFVWHGLSRPPGSTASASTRCDAASRRGIFRRPGTARD